MGYIIGTRISCIMVAGGVLAWLVFCPGDRVLRRRTRRAALRPATMLIRDMDAEQIRDAYVLYIGAGAVAAGGIISLLPALPLIVASIAPGFAIMRGSVRGRRADRSRRTDRDLSMRFVLFGSLVLVLAIWVFLGSIRRPAAVGRWRPMFNWVNLAAAVLIVLFGFLFVTVSSRLTGEIGSSSNPISGMTVATLLLTCLIFLALGLDRAAVSADRPCRWRPWSASPRPTAAPPRRTSRPASSSAPRPSSSSWASSSARSPRRW